MSGFDIPAMRKQIISSNKGLQEAELRQNHLKNSIQELNRTFDSKCKELGLDVDSLGSDDQALERQIYAMVKKLVPVFM